MDNMNDNCFCHFNGFAVKDATARQQIAAEAAARSAEIAAEAAAREKGIVNIKSKTDKLGLTMQRHVIYDTDNTNSIQGMCVDTNNRMYVYQETDGQTGQLIVFDLNTMRYVETISGLPMYHGNDLTYLTGDIYAASCFTENWGTGNAAIVKFNISTRTTKKINPFENEAINKVWGVSSYDENHLICAASTNANNNLSGLKFYLLDVNDLSYVEIPVYNPKQIPIDFCWYTQAIEYVNGYVYVSVSCTNAIVSFRVQDGAATMEHVYNLPYRDCMGISIGELEGLSKIPSNKYGEGTIAVSSVCYANDTKKTRTLKTYLVNPDCDMPALPIPLWLPVDDISGRRYTLHLNSESEELYEDGSKEYPFKDISRAIDCSNESELVRPAPIAIMGGSSYSVGTQHHKRIDIYPLTDREIKLKDIIFNCCNVYIEGNFSTTNNVIVIDGVANINATECALKKVAINGTLQMKYSSVRLAECVSILKEGFTADMDFSSSLFASVDSFGHDGAVYKLASGSFLTTHAALPDSRIIATSTCIVMQPGRYNGGAV